MFFTQWRKNGSRDLDEVGLLEYDTIIVYRNKVTYVLFENINYPMG